MSIENHNNWKSKLEELECLPGEYLPNKNISWEKLHARLGGKKRTKKAVWYWAAAACILLVLVIPLIIKNKKNLQLAHVEIIQKQPQVKTSLPVLNANKISAPNVNPGSDERATLVVDKSGNSKNNIIHQNKTKEIRVYDTVNLKDIVNSNNSKSMQPVDTSSSLTSIIPVRKKLRVIQINELGDPQESQPGLARNSNTHTFQFKFGNQEIFTNPSLASSDKGFTILKIRTSSN